MGDMGFDRDAYMAGMSLPTKRTREQDYAQQEKLLKMQLANKLDMMREQSGIENSQWTNDEKLYHNFYMKDPEGFRAFYEAKMPYGDAGLALRQAALGVQQGNLGLANERLDWQKNELPEWQKQINYLVDVLNRPREEATNQVLKIKPKSKFSFDSK